MRAALALLASGAALCILDAQAEAAPRTSSLAWVRLPGAEGCIDSRALARAVEERLGRAAFVPPTASDVALEGRIERAPGPAGTGEVWRATILVFDGKGAPLGARELYTPSLDCHAIDAELELVMALLIDPDAALAPPVALVAPSFPAPTSAPEPTRLVELPRRMAPPAPPMCPTPPPAPGPPFRVGVAASGILGLGFVPGPVGYGAAVRARLTPPRWPSFEIGGALWASSVMTSVRGSPAFSLTYGSLAICPFEVARGGTALSTCLGAMLGTLRVDGPDLAIKFHQEQLIFDLGLDARLRQRFVGALFGTAGFGIAVPTRHDVYYVIDDAGVRHDVFEASSIGVILDLGLGFELP